MEISVRLLIGCVSTMFLTIIGVYVWTFKISQGTHKQLGEIYKIVNSHIQEADIHTKKDEFVNQKVCNVIHKNICETLKEIKADVKTLIKSG